MAHIFISPMSTVICTKCNINVHLLMPIAGSCNKIICKKCNS